MDTPALVFEKPGNERRYRALLAGEEVGFADVDPISTDALLIKHTEVDSKFEGRGFAGALMRYILDDARAQSRKVIPVCPYAAAYIRKHPEYADLVRK
ncbi:MAG TPA: GNAT family N-acetyltransferase [Usitatibacter sp.]|nr:GNAT family N-acetyltransferase [Usitatibacter sp.]